MTVVSVTENVESRSCEEKVVLPPGRIDRTYQRTYLVLTNNDLDEASTIKNAASLPVMGVVYPADSGAILVSKKADKVGNSPYSWKVTCDWQSHFDFDPATLTENPLLRPATWSITWAGAERAVQRDLDDLSIVNSAKTPFVPPLSIPYGIPTIEITWNSATLTWLDLQDNQDCCNSDVWNGLAATSVLIKGIAYNRKFENTYLYWEKKATLQVRSLAIFPGGWETEYVLDQGFYENPFGVRKLIRGSTGEPLPEPSMLKDGLVKPNADDPVYLPFRLRRSIIFAGLIPT